MMITYLEFAGWRSAGGRANHSMIQRSPWRTSTTSSLYLIFSTDSRQNARRAIQWPTPRATLALLNWHVELSAMAFTPEPCRQTHSVFHRYGSRPWCPFHSKASISPTAANCHADCDSAQSIDSGRRIIPWIFGRSRTSDCRRILV